MARAASMIAASQQEMRNRCRVTSAARIRSAPIGWTGNRSQDSIGPDAWSCVIGSRRVARVAWT